MVKQSAVFLQVYISPNKTDALQALLNSGGNPNTSSHFFPFERMETVHFARWIIAPATEKFKPSLIYSGNVDGSADQHLVALSEHFPNELDLIFSHCENYPEQPTGEQRLSFLRKHSKKTPAFYVGAPERSVHQIKTEAKFHEALQQYIRVHRKEWRNQREAHAAIQSFIREDSDWAEILKSFSLPKKNGGKMILLLLVLLLLSPLVILAAILIFFFYELRLKPLGKTIDQIDLKKLERLKNQEDIIYQNQISQVFETKGGLRKVFLRFILWATNFAAKNWFVEGSLMGTPTIHFARWVFIDEGKRFVFFSNFDGSYDGYLGDFVDNNGWGLNAIYGAAMGYPRTYFVFGGGSYKLLQFLGWGRYTQVETPIWYSAYPWFGLQQIMSRSLLRDELLNNVNPTEAQLQQTLSRI